MITSMKVNIDFTKDFLGFTLEDTYPIPIDDKLKFYVPLLMPDIKKDKPKIYPAKTYGSSIFINSPECKPCVSNILKQQNYIVAEREEDTDLTRLLEKMDKKDCYYLPKDTKFEINFDCGRFSLASFN